MAAASLFELLTRVNAGLRGGSAEQDLGDELDELAPVPEDDEEPSKGPAAPIAKRKAPKPARRGVIQAAMK